MLRAPAWFGAILAAVILLIAASVAWDNISASQDVIDLAKSLATLVVAVIAIGVIAFASSIGMRTGV